MSKKLILVLLIFLSLKGCTRDDICSQETPTTPLLVIKFMDIDNATASKTVPGLTVKSDYLSGTTVIASVDTDSIGIPLRTTSDTVRYQFIKNTGTATEQIDVYSVIYDRENIYINRACSFKTVYTSLTFEIENENPENWIRSRIINNSTVADENQAHITLFH